MCYIKKNKDGGIEANLSIFTFEEDGIVHVYCPSLDMFGYDKTEKLAMESFAITFREYLRYTIGHNTLEADLIKHGWTVKGKYKSPSMLRMLESNKELRSIITKKESFRKMDFPYIFAQ